MGSISLINGHVDEPENGVYCWQCKHSDFDSGCVGGICKVGRMGIITPNSYCNRGDSKEEEE